MNAARDDSGAALLSVILMVAIMAAVAVSLTDTGLRSIARASLADERGRVSWQITGAEQAGLAAVHDLLVTSRTELSNDNPVLSTPIIFAAAGGSITGRLSDASNCFNINALANLGEIEDDIDDQPIAVQAYSDLLLALQLSEFEVEALTDALLDWLDPDTTPRIAGAEDGYYLTQSPPYRTSGRPLVDLSELRAILGYEPALLNVLLPQVCVRDGSDVGRFNVNTLKIEHAPLLVMLLGGSATIEEAEDIIARRPFGGWSSLEAFTSIDTVSRIAPEILRTDLMSLTTNYLTFQGSALFGDVSADFETLYAIGEAETVQIVRRKRSAR